MNMRLLLALLLTLASSAFAQTSGYYIPPGVTNVRAMIIGGLVQPKGPSVDTQNFCIANRVGLAQLSSDLPAIATATGNDGFNMNRGGDTQGEIFTINAAAVAGVPQVHTFDNGDGFVSPVTLQGWVEYGRSLAAPWYFLIHNDGSHTDLTILDAVRQATQTGISRRLTTRWSRARKP